MQGHFTGTAIFLKEIQVTRYLGRGSLLDQQFFQKRFQMTRHLCRGSLLEQQFFQKRFQMTRHLCRDSLLEQQFFQKKKVLGDTAPVQRIIAGPIFFSKEKFLGCSALLQGLFVGTTIKNFNCQSYNLIFKNIAPQAQATVLVNMV